MSAEIFLKGRVQLCCGDSLHFLRDQPDGRYDSVVTDPPYALAFMGKRWDTAETAFDPGFWAEVLRVLKPGGHVVAFGGTRTYHRLACAIEDAGFEIRDQLQWIYGSGFPKSHDVSKGIDRANGKHDRDLAPFGAYVRELREGKGWSLRKLDEVMGTNTAASWWEGRKSGVQPPGSAQYHALKAILGMDDRFDELIEWLEAEREIIGQDTKARSTSGDSALPTVGGETIYKTWNITTPATNDAQAWQGWGTALKPSAEPICFARKPLIGTVAANVLQHGTGAINIDGCRIGTSDVLAIGAGVLGYHGADGSNPGAQHLSGRWPANICHDGSDEVIAAFPESGDNWRESKGGNGFSGLYKGGGGTVNNAGVSDAGSAARFFYQAKADQNDRLGSRHPTVKPVDLMQWLVRLVTPKGGLCLDPFAGTGTTAEACYREGMRCMLVERETEYQADIRRRMALVLAGPDERSRESIKAKTNGHPIDHGPLFSQTL